MTDDIEQPAKIEPPKTGQLFLATLATFAYFGVLTLCMFQPIPDKNHDIIITMLSVAGSVLLATWAFYFGSSIGSRNKEAVIDKLSTGPTVIETTTRGTGENLTTKTTTTQPAGGAAPIAVNVAPTPESAPVTVTVQSPPSENPKD